MLILSMEDDPRYVRAAFAGGASGYVLKEAADNELVWRSARSLAAAATWTRSRGAADRGRGQAAERRADADPLSEREHEILRLFALGHTNQEIANRLFISVRTAETHRAHIMQKLQLSTRAELVTLRARERVARADLSSRTARALPSLRASTRGCRVFADASGPHRAYVRGERSKEKP